MLGTVFEEVQINVPASEAWKIFGTLQMTQIVSEKLSNIFERIDVEEGDGGIGTILKLSFPPGLLAFSYYKEKFTVVDNEKRIKVAEMIEGGYLDLGFKRYRGQFEVIENGENSCIVKATIEYELDDVAAARASIVNIQPLVSIMETVANHLITKDQE